MIIGAILSVIVLISYIIKEEMSGFWKKSHANEESRRQRFRRIDAIKAYKKKRGIAVVGDKLIEPDTGVVRCVTRVINTKLDYEILAENERGGLRNFGFDSGCFYEIPRLKKKKIG